MSLSSRSLLLLTAMTACAGAVFACGGISDPTKNGETVATVSGSLTGTAVPSGARVALVWRTASSSSDAGGYALGDDVPVVNGKFSINLAVPASAYFSQLDEATKFASDDTNSGSTEPTQTGTAVPPSSGSSTSGSPGSSTSSSSGGSSSGSSGFKSPISPKDMAGGSIVTQPLTAAVAGFVVYVDTNGNGKLDLTGQYASSTDTVLGGASDLVLTYLKDGGALDYEKLRDGSGILPVAGFNLAWTDKERWLPLNEVELTLSSNPQLPYPVCSNSGTYSGGGSSSSSSGSVDPVGSAPVPQPAPVDTVDAGAGTSSSSSSGSSGSSSGGSSGYPDPSDPNLHCSADGTSFTYEYPSTPCPTPPPAPTGLCAGDVGYSDVGCATGGGYGSSLPSGPIPDGWPCTVTSSADGGTLDGGSADGG